MIGQPAIETGTSEKSKYRQILSQKTLHLLAFFSLIYVGVEVTIGGMCWFFMFRQDYRYQFLRIQAGRLLISTSTVVGMDHQDTSPQDTSAVSYISLKFCSSKSTLCEFDL